MEFTIVRICNISYIKKTYVNHPLSYQTYSASVQQHRCKTELTKQVTNKNLNNHTFSLIFIFARKHVLELSTVYAHKSTYGICSASNLSIRRASTYKRHKSLICEYIYAIILPTIYLFILITSPYHTIKVLN